MMIEIQISSRSRLVSLYSDENFFGALYYLIFYIFGVYLFINIYELILLLLNHKIHQSDTI
jgi:hypothetical protein